MTIAVPAPSAAILVLDTASEHCHVAVSYLPAGGHPEVVDAASELVGNRHSERALPMIAAVLARNGLAVGDCAGFAFGAGPGSFTGLRIACGIVQGLAYGCGRPVLGVGNLHALAAAAAPAGGAILVAIDARMNQVYCAAYEATAAAAARGEWREIVAPRLAGKGDIAPLAATCGAVDLVANVEVAMPPGAKRRAWPAPGAQAEAMARIAGQGIRGGRGGPAALAAPLYVRERVALTVEERRAAPAGRVA
ncbi:MAG TPA: tRNA (adenosine(37)-N6)-threonylcarbamoyltransferase complex dimerization subunit type 1 TsaB [Burkholderiaceae bacterium]|nr:tRNA (adenosine(37)-N6)-threonylcarbamoyltransferase complex dimerization subunit type 1 TsaB [Burkholderiaceae bacterium]